ncbi:hypothetical protein [Streptomyces hebeiensis]
MPTPEISRRTALRFSAVAALSAGATVTSAVPAHAGKRRPGDELPEVPGMHGDRRANEMWYRFDDVTNFKASPELMEAYTAIAGHLGGDVESAPLRIWREMSAHPDYPYNFVERFRPLVGPLTLISRTQLGCFDRYYPRHGSGLVRAFSYFGQGVLFDPRRADVKSEVHAMNGAVPRGYHVWHVYIRAMTLLGVDRERWAAIASLNAFAWALQSVARPDLRAVNPPLPAGTVARLAAGWLPRDAGRLDSDFQSFPYPAAGV